MPTSKLSAKTNKEILILLNSQLENLEKEVIRLCQTIEKKADVKDTDSVSKKVDILWDWRNRVIGMSIGVGAIAGGVAGAVVNALGRL